MKSLQREQTTFMRESVEKRFFALDEKENSKQYFIHSRKVWELLTTRDTDVICQEATAQDILKIATHLQRVKLLMSVADLEEYGFTEPLDFLK